MKIVFLCSQPYSGDFKIGSHHLFDYVQYEKIFIDFPMTPFHIIHKLFLILFNLLTGRLKVSSSHFKDLKRLWFTRSLALLTPRKIKPLDNAFFIRHWWIFYPKLYVIYLLSKIQPMIIYVDCPQFLPFAHVCTSRVIYRVADDYSQFDYWTDAIEKIEGKYVNNIWLNYVSSRYLKQIPRYVGSKVLLNGVRPPREVNFTYQRFDDRVVYVGSLEKWFDIELVCYCAKNNPDVFFDIFGPSKEWDGLTLPRNVILHGALDYKDLYYYLGKYKVGIIPFDIWHHKDLIKSVRPLKLFEYLSVGCRVVSTRWQEIELDLNDLYLSNNYADFSKNIKTALLAGPGETPISTVKTWDWMNIAQTVEHDIYVKLKNEGLEG